MESLVEIAPTRRLRYARISHAPLDEEIEAQVRAHYAEDMAVYRNHFGDDGMLLNRI